MFGKLIRSHVLEFDTISNVLEFDTLNVPEFDTIIRNIYYDLLYGWPLP